MLKKFSVNSTIIPFDLEKKLYQKLIVKGDFGKADKKKINKLSIKYNVDSNILKSLRSQLLKEKVIKRHFLVKKYKLDILNDYQSNDILWLSNKYDISPMTIIRMIIEEKYNDKFKKALKKINLDDRKQLELAEINDITSQMDQTELQKESIEFEIKIAKVLKKKEVRFKTQEDLIKEQEEMYGKAIITPDFLLDEEIIINDKKVKWIEVKNFYGSNVKHFRNSVKKQINRYYNKWGRGCIVYRYAYSSELNYDDNIIISF
jgi:hypothetical protein